MGDCQRAATLECTPFAVEPLLLVNFASMSESVSPPVKDHATDDPRTAESSRREVTARGTSLQATGISLLLVVVIGIVFYQVTSFSFVFYDDPIYVVRNPDVLAGTTPSSIRAAFTKTVAANWHPLTMLSHTLDGELYGLRWPGGHHLTSLILHAATTVVLFLVLRSATARIWPAAFVAALFAWHPMHVESVAWVSERKDVLSTLFGFAAIGAYLGWVRRGRWWRYLLTTLLFVASLMSKPMFVTFPCVLLLLDFWPLDRLHIAWPLKREMRSEFIQRVVEKIPLFVVTAVFCVVTFIAQRATGAVRGFDSLPIDVRLINAILSYRDYLGKLFWPTKLVVLYPLLGREFTWATALLNLALLIAVTVMIVRISGRFGYVACGWFWYLGMMVPVIGIIQVGSQAMADRYTYVPFVGLFLIIAYGLADWSRQSRTRRIAATCASVAWLLVLAIVAHRQVGYWSDTSTLFSHTLAHTRNNYQAHYTYASGLIEQYHSALYAEGAARDPEVLYQALEQFEKALEIRPNYEKVYYNRGYAYRMLANLDMAAANYRRAIELGHRGAAAYANLAECLLLMEKPEAALELYDQALELEPNALTVWQGRGLTLAKLGRVSEALEQFERVLDIQPNATIVLDRIAWIRATHPDAEYRDATDAIQRAERACTLTGKRPRMLDTLAAAYAEAGRFDLAVATEREALRRHRSVSIKNESPHRREARKNFEARLVRRINRYLRSQPTREPPRQSDLGYLI